MAKFDKNGDWVKSWGERGTETGQFNTPHTIAADAKGNIYVGDRGNRRIQVFDSDGNHLRTIAIDVPWDASGTQYLFSSDAYPGRVYKLSLDGKVLGWLGKSGHQLKQFGWIHEIACPSENEPYVGELLNWRVQKLVLRPSRQSTSAGR